ncbi:MAG: RimK family alpha-L-glutamate ligase [Candidatus Coproplasma sp.]
MKGWLVVNAFLKIEKFNEIYALLQRAFADSGVGLQLRTGADLVCPSAETVGVALPDFVLFWDKDYSLAKRLESAGLPVFNSPESVAICDDKILTQLALDKAGVRTPETVIAPKTFDGVGYNDLGFVDTAAHMLGLPMVIKQACGSFGKQVYIAETAERAKDIIKNFGSNAFLMQRFISESRGRDVRVNVVGGKVVCAMLRENKDDFRSNITNGGKAERYVPTEQEEMLALAACSAVGVDFAGVDVLFGADGPYICEVNSNPHFKSTLDCTGVNLAEHIARYVLGKIR